MTQKSKRRKRKCHNCDSDAVFEYDDRGWQCVRCHVLVREAA